ncbi:MAG: phenylalanine--tRNA ligase subunit beta [Patescibacteria group bacterium]
MLLSKEWLQEFVALPKNLSDEEIARRLSLCTVEVERIQKGASQDWNAIVIGEIVELKPHPNADRLRLVMTRISEKQQPLVIVCGGSNLSVGMKVVVALPGSHVRWHGEGEPVELTLTQIRGVTSEGMICAASEVGLSDRYPATSEHEILDLSFLSVKPGTPLTDALGAADTIFDVDNKSLSNRPDLWGHRGMARELGAVLQVPFSDKKIPLIKSSSQIKLSCTVEEKKLCTRYMAVVIEGVSTMSSPSWMQQRLRSCGVRPINAIVDVTNYVMLEYGQPMHAFDYARIKEKNGDVKLHVRRAKKGESIRALDGKEYVLSPEMLLIAKSSDVLAIAGIMGGEKSGIDDSTTTIVLEAAHFNASSIRKTSSAIKLASESSRRFEKHLDPLLTETALRRACELYSLLFPSSKAVSKVCDTFTQKEKPLTITLSDALIESKLGMRIPQSKAATLLKRLGFGLTKKGLAYSVVVPSFRKKDISIPEDVIEEIIRLIGYDSIPSVVPPSYSRMPKNNSFSLFVTALKQQLSSEYHFNEVHNYAFVTPFVLRAGGYVPEEHITLSNPYSDERPYLCKSLIPNLLEDIEKNQERHERIALFEIARVFTDELQQPYHLSCVLSLPRDPQAFAFLKSVIVSVLRCRGFDISPRVLSEPLAWSSHFRGVGLYCNTARIGSIAVVDKSVCAKLGIERDVVACEVDLSLVHSLPRHDRSIQQPHAYPAVLRDVTFVLDEGVRYTDVSAMLTSAHPLIESVEPFDIYRGEQVGSGKKSFSFHITYRSSARTLAAAEADKAHIEAIALLEKKFNAVLR